MTNDTLAAASALNREVHVLWLAAKAWEEELKVVPQHAPLLLDQWLQIIRDEHMIVRRLPDGHIQGGPCDGGQVVRVDAVDDTNYFALPSEAIAALHGLLSAQDYAAVLHQSSAGAIW